MDLFTTEFPVRGMIMSLIVTPLDAELNRFKVEMITGAPNPVLLKRSVDGTLEIEDPGKWRLTIEELNELSAHIDQKIKEKAQE
ncbi:hypothetical protein FW774_09830 [Pedobacter sp. BS3]|uniref:hypothetical protein n=1 Tax=Pedobacter sp. BS3 TaxID=2567937 RepID=UPI0011EDEFFE|nr:hypothetical protein [Pedobacter sp. BS3]TZF83758.1 hypothetical protein FW774_09830 [Pedobacter sp. BS3]